MLNFRALIEYYLYLIAPNYRYNKILQIETRIKIKNNPRPHNKYFF